MLNGPHVLHVEPTMAGFARAAADFRTALESAGGDGRAMFRAELVFEEIVTNVIRHGRRDDRPPSIDVAVTCSGDEIVLTFEDDGRPFDPLQRPDPVPPTSIEDAPLGGLGVMMVRKTASRIAYERTADDRNRLTVAVASAQRA